MADRVQNGQDCASQQNLHKRSSLAKCGERNVHCRNGCARHAGSSIGEGGGGKVKPLTFPPKQGLLDWTFLKPPLPLRSEVKRTPKFRKLKMVFSELTRRRRPQETPFVWNSGKNCSTRFDRKKDASVCDAAFHSN